MFCYFLPYQLTIFIDKFIHGTIILLTSIPKQVRQLFDQKRLDWFVNQPHVKQCSDTTQVITITMDEEWSSNVNGIKLFEAMNKVSTNIKMKLTSGCIVVSLAKRGKYMDLLWECMHILLNQ